MFVLIIEWHGITAQRREVQWPFASRAAAWAWWRQQTGYPRGVSVRCEEKAAEPWTVEDILAREG